MFAQSKVKSASIAAVVTRADGRVENLGVISYWHRNPLKRLAWQASRHPFLFAAMAAVGAAALVAAPHVAPLVGLGTVFTYAGMAVATNLVSGLGGTVPKYIGWGTGATGATQGGTTLSTEDSGGSPTYARVSGTVTRVTTSQTNDTVQVVGTLTSNGSKTITNAGTFDALTVGNLFVWGSFTGIPLLLNDTIAFTVTLQFT